MITNVLIANLNLCSKQEESVQKPFLFPNRQMLKSFCINVTPATKNSTVLLIKSLAKRTDKEKTARETGPGP